MTINMYIVNDVWFSYNEARRWMRLASENNGSFEPAREEAAIAARLCAQITDENEAANCRFHLNKLMEALSC